MVALYKDPKSKNVLEVKKENVNAVDLKKFDIST